MKYEIYHDSFTSAMAEAVRVANSKGFEIDELDWFNKVTVGPKKPSEGVTNRYIIGLLKDGKESKKALAVQVYGMRLKYELNCYVS